MGVEVDPAWWTSGVWGGRPIREFLERRDMTTTFRFLHARGISYGVVGGLVGISPNRVSEIARGVRQVTAYEVLERIAIGLRIPRELMGLGCNRDPDTSPSTPTARGGDGEDCGPAGAADWPRAKDGAVGVNFSALARLRSELDEALAASSVSPRQLDLIEESAAEHMEVYPATPPTVMMLRLAAECVEVQTLSRRRQPAAVQARLSGTAALLATMCADALMRVGDVGDARLWYRTAIHAADDSAEARLRVLVRAQAAMLPYYFGDPRQTVSTAEAALDIPAPPCPSSALAAAGRARALARIGAVEAARAAIGQARRLFDQGGDADSDTAFRFPAKRLLFYLSGASTWLGDTGEAYRVQDEALELYRLSPATSIDPALIQLDRSMCLVRERRAIEAAVTAREAMAALPEVQRTEIVLTRACAVVAAVPLSERRGEVTTLADYVETCREGARRLSAGTAALDT